jgi:hypothetical protein
MTSRRASRRTVAALAVALTAMLAVTSCVGPSRTRSDFRRKADTTVDNVRGAVQTAIVGIQATDRHSLQAAYVSVLLGDAEEDASAAADTFAGIQPPDARSDRVRAVTNELVGESVDALADARIVARRGDLAELTPMLPNLRRLARRLERLSADLDGVGR